jgi:hypothetical protein
VSRCGATTPPGRTKPHRQEKEQFYRIGYTVRRSHRENLIATPGSVEEVSRSTYYRQQAARRLILTIPAAEIHSIGAAAMLDKISAAPEA